MHYYTHNIGEYATLTKFMNFEEKGIFVDFVDRYLTTGKPLDSQWVSIVKRVASEGAVENVLALAFEEKDGCFYNADCEKKLAEYAAMAEKNRRNAERRSKKQHVEPVATQSQPSRNPLDTLTNNQELITNKKEKEKKEKPHRYRGIDPRGFDDDSHYDLPPEFRTELTPEAMIPFDPECGF